MSLYDELADPRELNLLWGGGYPESLLAANETTSFEWRDAFVSTYLERDIPQLGPRIPAETLRRFWTMLAHAQGTLLNAASCISAMAPVIPKLPSLWNGTGRNLQRKNREHALPV